MNNKRLDNILNRQKRHLIRDAFALFALVAVLAAGAMAMVFATGRLAPQPEPGTPDATLIVKDQPAQYTAQLISNDAPDFFVQ